MTNNSHEAGGVVGDKLGIQESSLRLRDLVGLERGQSDQEVTPNVPAGPLDLIVHRIGKEKALPKIEAIFADYVKRVNDFKNAITQESNMGKGLPINPQNSDETIGLPDLLDEINFFIYGLGPQITKPGTVISGFIQACTAAITNVQGSFGPYSMISPYVAYRKMCEIENALDRLKEHLRAYTWDS